MDELGGIDRAIEIVKAKAKIGKDEKVRLVAYPPKKSIYEMLFSRNIETSLESKLEARLREVFQGFDPRLWMQGGMLKAMPYQVEIR